MESHLTFKSVKSIFSNLIAHIDVKVIMSFLAVALNWIFGADMQFLYVISALIVLDTMTGVCVAAKRGQVSSYGFFRFVMKVVVYFALSAAACIIDRVLPVKCVHPIMFTFLAITETLSVFENSITLGFPVPKKLYHILKISSELLDIDSGKGKD